MGKRGTIVYVGGFELPDKNAAAHRVINNGKVFTKLGYNVVYLGISHEYKEFTKVEHFGFDCYFTPYPKGFKNWLKYLTDIKTLKHVISLYEDVVAVVFYNYQAGALKKAIKFCKKNNIKTIADVTEWYLPEKKNPIFYIIKKWDTETRMKKLQPKMDGVIAISKFLNDYYIKKGVKTVQVPPLIDKEDKKWKVERDELNNLPLKMVYAGNSSDLKDNFSLLLDCIKEFEEKIELEVIGNVKLSSEKANEYKNVKILKRLSHEECVKKIANSHFQVFLREDNLVTRAGFPTKLPESFSCKTPVITTVHSNVCDYIIDGKNSFVISKITKEGITEVLNKVTNLSYEELKEMKNSLEENKFDYRLFILKFEGFLESI